MKLEGIVCVAVSCALMAACAGCTQSSAAVDAARVDGSRFLLAEKPADVMSVCDVRDVLPSDAPIAIVGRIGGIENPWTLGEASFVMSDPSLISLAKDGHDCGEDCPYCAKQKKEEMNAMAFVQMVDEQGRVVRTDARRLLGVAEDQMIVVVGRASLNRTGHIVVAASGLYVRE